jgi:hypothetical protein
MQAQLTDDRMVHDGGAAVEAAHVVARPQSSEPLARQGELAHQFHKARVVDIVADGLPEGGDEPFRGARPVLLERLLLGIEEQRPKPVVPGLKARRERDREPVGREHIERAPFHERGNPHARQELVQPCGHAFGLAAPPRPRARACQAEEVFLLELVKAQDPRERFEDLR